MAEREKGMPFDLAWRKVWRCVAWPHDTIHRREWKEALRESREVWRCAYERRPSDPLELSLQALDLVA